jgi:uncharacterized membrane protein
MQPDRALSTVCQVGSDLLTGLFPQPGDSLNRRSKKSKENDMSILIAAFVLGFACGLRALVGLAAVSWAASSQHLPLQSTWLSLLGSRVTSYISSVLAVGEIINDKLPKTPSRLAPSQFGARVFMGALTGSAIGLSRGNLAMGALAGILGSVAGTLVGAKSRAYTAKLFGRDLPAALLEDVVAVALAFVALR